jgi:hypothetical protein
MPFLSSRDRCFPFRVSGRNYLAAGRIMSWRKRRPLSATNFRIKVRALAVILALPSMLTACGGGGSSGTVNTASASSVRAGLPVVKISFSPAEVTTSAQSNLTWTADNATSCNADGAWSGAQNAMGIKTIAPAGPGSYVYQLTCNGPGGSATSSATLIVTAAASPAATSASWIPPYGLYVGNPNSNDAAEMTVFQGRWDASIKQLGRPPQFFGTFTDFSQDWLQWRSNAGWTAGSFNNSKRVSGMKPVIGIKLSTNAYWGKQNDAFREIISGKRDDVYRGVVNAWRENGYKELRFRISYEFNGNFMPDNFGNDAETLSLWKQAFAHVADVMHAVPDVKVLIVWNPANINFSGNSVVDAYPGDQYVDVIANDIYSRQYPLSMVDWSTNAKAATLKDWFSNPANRIHFWDFPGATENTAVGSGWGLVQAMNFALARRKPFGISESGVGGDDVKTGPSDDPQFPSYLTSRLSDFVKRGGTVDHVIIWDYDAGDGKWRFTGVPTKSATAAAWTTFVNPGSAA